MSLSSLILLRHGETEYNRTTRLQGQLDVSLNDTGRDQAAAAAPSVAALRPDVIVSSDLMRARQTADAVAERTGLPVGTDSRLRETSLGEWEGLTLAEVLAGWPEGWQRWRTTSADYAPPGGESRWQVSDRASQVVDELDGSAGTAPEAGRALLVAHGGLIVGLVGRLLELPPPTWGRLAGISNCHWVELHRREDGWRLHSYNAGLSHVHGFDPNNDEVAGT